MIAASVKHDNHFVSKNRLFTVIEDFGAPNRCRYVPSRCRL